MIFLPVPQPPGFPFSLNSAVDKLLPYVGDDSWIDGVIFDAIECLKSDKLPKCGEDSLKNE